MTRVFFEVRFNKAEGLWMVKRRDISAGVLAYAKTKREAETRGRAEARAHEASGGKAELVLYRLDGSIGEGHSSRSSYPRSSDPRGSKG